MNNKIVRISALFVLMINCAFAQKKDTIVSKIQLDEVVISDSKFALPREKSGKVIVKISPKDLSKKSGQSLATVLSSVAGLEVNGNQSVASNVLSYYIRGARSRQTLIIIDGIPVSDASGINLDYDLRLLPVDQVESVEIMKGAASTLYGSGAAAGVINIKLKKSAKKEISGNVYLNLGSQTTADNKNYNPAEYNQGFSFGANKEKFNYYVGLNSTEIKGISESKGTDFEDDAFSRLNSVFKLGFKPTEKFDIDFYANYDKVKNEFDSGAFADNLDNFNNSEQLRVGFSPKYKYNGGEVVLNSSANLIERDYFRFGGITHYKSRNINADAFNKYKINSELFIVAGAQFQFHEMSIESQYTTIANELAKFNFIDPYVNWVFTSDFGLNVNAGGRLNIHSNYGNHFVYNINPSYNFKNSSLKIITSYSTAYITPSLYQMYDSDAGNLALEAEGNSTIEAGFEVKLLKNKMNVSSVAFYREEKNAIEYYYNPSTYEASYFNATGRYNAKGIETSVDFVISDQLDFKVNYTFNEVDVKAVNNTFPDIKANLYNPKHKINASAEYQFSNRAFFGISYQYLDKRDGFLGYPPVVNVLGAYQLVNASAKYELIKNRMTIFGAVSNIFNEDFVEIVGYNTRGRNFKLGLNINL
jgi:vitamin B12 transporter